MSLNIIVSVDRCNNILRQEHFLYDIKDRKTQNINIAVIMDKYTWEQIPQNFKPLKNRVNIIIDDEGLEINTPNTIWIPTINQAIYQYSNFEIYVLGEENMLQYILDNYVIDYIYMTIYNVIEIDNDELGSIPNIDEELYQFKSEELIDINKGTHFRVYAFNNKLNIFL